MSTSSAPTFSQQSSNPSRTGPPTGPPKFVPRPSPSTGSSGVRQRTQQQQQQLPFATNPNPTRVPNPQFVTNSSQNQMRTTPPPPPPSVNWGIPPKNVATTKPLSTPSSFSQQTPQASAAAPKMVSFAEDESVFSQKVPPESTLAAGTSGPLSLLSSLSTAGEGSVGDGTNSDGGQKKKGGALNVKTTAWIIGSVVVVLIMIAVIYTIMRIKKNEKELKKLKEKEVPVMDPDDVKYLIQDFIEKRPEDLHRAVSKHALAEAKQKQQQALQQQAQQAQQAQQLKIQQQQEELKKQENIAKLRQQQQALQQALLQQQAQQQQQQSEDSSKNKKSTTNNNTSSSSKTKEGTTTNTSPSPETTSTKAPSTTGSVVSDPAAGQSSSSSTSSTQQKQEKVDPETVSLTEPVTIDPIGETSVDDREVDGMPEKEYLQKKRQEQQDSILQEAKRKAELIKEADKKNREKREKEAKKREVDAAIDRVISINRN